MTTFNCNETDYITISIDNLLFDERIADMVEQNGMIFPDSLLSNIYDAGTFHLNQERLIRVLSGYNENLPAVKVSKTLNNKYKVIDGRHRVCAAIMKGDLHVPCVVV